VSSAARQVEAVDSLDDPRVWHYRDLKDRALDRSGRWFIAEGEHVVRRLLASDFPVESYRHTSRCTSRLRH
jgi:tRNA G18 (ribose-2'-O)-methylase SpoU